MRALEVALACTLIGASPPAAAGGPSPTQTAEVTPRPSVAFHYGRSPPLDQLAVFDWVVLEPAGLLERPAALAELAATSTSVAYVALSEVQRSGPWGEWVPIEARIGRNPDWGSEVLDPSHPGWRAALLDRILPRLWKAGFRGFFFDAIDSFETRVPEPRRPRIWSAVAELVQEVRRQYPKAVLLMNRGFPVIDRVAERIDGVVAESLWSRYDADSERYREVPDADRAWLGARLAEVRRHGLPTIVVDYVPARDRARARAVARRLAEAGHIPWVAPAELDALGVGALEVLPRDVLVVVDARSSGGLVYSAALQRLALPLEHLGLVPRFADVRGPLPERRLAGEVAGVVAWAPAQPPRAPDRYRRFLLRQVDDGVPLVFFGGLGVEEDQALRAALGLERGGLRSAEGAVVTHRHPATGFETERWPAPLELSPLHAPEAEPWLEMRVGGETHHPILVAPWGGLVEGGYAFETSAEAHPRWRLDPFAFLEAALQLGPERPVVDPTTEEGRRLLVVHIDGDGAASRSELPGRPFAIEVIRERLERSELPHTVSVVEGELSTEGLHPELAPKLQREARRIFSFPHVEPASHGFAHPFVWARYERGEPAQLPLPGGRPSLERELLGSIAFASRLAGRPVSVFLWTGDAVPGPRSVGLLRRAGIRAMNGGYEIPTRDHPSVALVSPRARPLLDPERGDRWGEVGLQVYAPILNENVLTRGWTGPFWGYRRVRETFDITGRPRRLTPIGIYYHFFSATKVAGLTALDEVYADARARDPFPVFASTWIAKVEQTRRSVVARHLHGGWTIDRVDRVRTLRAPSAGRIDLGRSLGVVGDHHTPVGRFVDLDGRRRVHLHFHAPAGGDRP